MSWQDRFPQSQLTCVRCLEIKDKNDLDRLRWCDPCRDTARRRASLWGWTVGFVTATLLTLWIWIFIQPSDLVIGGWIGTCIAALWLSSKVAREITYGVMRFKNGKAVEARPPGGEAE